ncbi:MAG: TrbI/VirB10 family protein [Pseudomonadota bacterium]|nr:TrbI/VirB10 family protein [Pseudomonadota bacterium]
MSTTELPDNESRTVPPKIAPDRLELRARPRAVTRLSRRALILLGSVSSMVIGGLAIWALSVDRNGGAAPEELYSTERKPVAEGLNTLPRDYSGLQRQPLPPDVPPLGPPLPGDLGRPILSAGGGQTPPVGTAPPTGPVGPSPEEQARLAELQRRRQEADAAARSALFARVRQEGGQAPAAGPEVANAGDGTRRDPFAPLPGSAAGGREDETFAQNGQSAKSAFLNAPADQRVYASGRLQTPASPYQVMAGTIIPAAMVTGLNSGLPGQAIATVTEAVYDTVTGGTLLIPQGSRLLGQYDAQVSFGQSRVLLVWNRLVMPDGSSITLDRLPGADTRGFAGLEDETDNHWGKLLAGAALSTLLGVGAELGSGNRGSIDGNDTVVVAAGRSAQESANQVGQQITRRNLDIQPTLTVRPGFPVRVIVNKDLVLRPYGAAIRRNGAIVP